MLLEFNALENSNPRGFLRVTQLIAHLMRNQFVHVEDRGAATLLETLHRPDLAKLVETYFDVAGYRLVHRETEGWAGILPDPERTSLPRMRIDETIALPISSSRFKLRLFNKACDRVSASSSSGSTWAEIRSSRRRASTRLSARSPSANASASNLSFSATGLLQSSSRRIASSKKRFFSR